jgi:hypothetical protein
MAIRAAQHDSIQVSIESEPGVALISKKSEKRTIDRFHQKNSEKNLRQLGAFNASQKKRPDQIEFFLNAEGPSHRQGAVAVDERLVVVAYLEKGRPASSKATGQPAQEPHNIKDWNTVADCLSRRPVASISVIKSQVMSKPKERSLPRMLPQDCECESRFP